MAWNKITMPKAEGGLGVLDPLVKAKAMHAQWLIHCLLPGAEPWKVMLRCRLDAISAVSGGAGSWIWAMGDEPCLTGIRLTSLEKYLECLEECQTIGSFEGPQESR